MEFQLPRDFEGTLNLVVVAFKREQQHDVDRWMTFLNSLAHRHDDVRIYELPTLGRRYRVMRPFIDGGMRRGVTDRATRLSTITLYIDKAPFRRALGLPDEDRIYILLVDRLGHVHGRVAGPFGAESGAALQDSVAGFRPEPVTPTDAAPGEHPSRPSRAR